MAEWKNRFASNEIKFAPADQFLSNPDNPRQHPDAQRKAVKGSLDSLGWVAPVIVNSRTGYLVDGHERIWQGLQNGNAIVPYIEIDLDETEEKQFLTTFDYITYMATYDRDVLESLMHDVQSDDENIQALLAGMAEGHGITPPDFGALSMDEQPQLDAKIVICPHCDCEFYLRDAES